MFPENPRVNLCRLYVELCVNIQYLSTRSTLPMKPIMHIQRCTFYGRCNFVETTIVYFTHGDLSKGCRHSCVCTFFRLAALTSGEL